ncbi:MAG: DNA ligase [Gallionella sp.]|nr:DNA ligase [Gallionella sp.]
MARFLFFILTIFALGGPAPLRAGEAPPLMLANVLRGDVVLADFLVSEKYDGVRGYWDGRQLLTRGGAVVHAPAWFTAGWLGPPLDGELWAGRGKFSQAVSTVRQQMPEDGAWRGMRFMVFDLPGHPGTFAERNAALTSVIAEINQPWLQQVEQFSVTDRSELQTLLKRIVKQGGEGLMLHRGSSLYRAERNDDLLKLKPYEDAEARVVGYLPGKGKFVGMLGALRVETPERLRFNLGAGLSDAERRNPPPVGSWVTYRYNGVNARTGIPRFARFLRVREEMDR